MKKPPAYTVGQHIALRWRAIGEAAPGLYTLQQSDGTPHGVSWQPRFNGVYCLPTAITVWAEVAFKPAKDHYTLALPKDLGGDYVTLSAQEVAACEIQLNSSPITPPQFVTRNS